MASFHQRMSARVRLAGPTCVGLDPHLESLPVSVLASLP